MLQDIFKFFNQMLAVGSSVVDAGSATAGDVTGIVTGSLGLPDIELPA